MATRTIAVAGFPPDITWREMKNMCRLARGFEAAHVANAKNGKAPNLFVKFTSPEAAERALVMLQNMVFDEEHPEEPPLRAELAWREMDVREPRRTPAQGPMFDEREVDRGGGGHWRGSGERGQVTLRRSERSPPRRERSPRRREDIGRPALPPPPHHRDGDPTLRKRRRTPSPVPRPRSRGRGGGDRRTMDDYGMDEIDTLACKTNGQSKTQIREFFENIAGFVGLKFNERVHACFVKFDGQDLAEQAMDLARAEGLNAELARRNLELH